MDLEQSRKAAQEKVAAALMFGLHDPENISKVIWTNYNVEIHGMGATLYVPHKDFQLWLEEL
jgi:hypothetical protein